MRPAAVDPWNPDTGIRVRILTFLVAVAVLLSGGGLASDSSVAASGKKIVVKKAHNKRLDRTILVNLRGRSLYSLSAERDGRFICTDAACLSLWRPLLIAHGKPAGAPSLGTVKRPNGKVQVTYRGRPLYRFTEDRRPGDVNGEGFRDVGVWRAARA
jgi:predicted lipoprotein with Yx(FWY)xxD motif